MYADTTRSALARRGDVNPTTSHERANCGYNRRWSRASSNHQMRTALSPSSPTTKIPHFPLERCWSRRTTSASRHTCSHRTPLPSRSHWTHATQHVISRALPPLYRALVLTLTRSTGTLLGSLWNSDERPTFNQPSLLATPGPAVRFPPTRRFSRRHPATSPLSGRDARVAGGREGALAPRTTLACAANRAGVPVPGERPLAPGQYFGRLIRCFYAF